MSWATWMENGRAIQPRYWVRLLMLTCPLPDPFAISILFPMRDYKIFLNSNLRRKTRANTKEMAS